MIIVQTRPLPEIHVLGMCVHGAMMALHTLGVIYNLRRRNRPETLLHVCAIGCSVYAVYKHLSTEES